MSVLRDLYWGGGGVVCIDGSVLGVFFAWVSILRYWAGRGDLGKESELSCSACAGEKFVLGALCCGGLSVLRCLCCGLGEGHWSVCHGGFI